MDLINNIKNNEGFVGEPYNDTLGIPTIGFGTKLPLNEDEAEMILKSRLHQKMAQLVKAEPFVNDLPSEVRDVLYEMSYQLGVGGLLKFKKMFKALKKRDYNEAYIQAMDSKWAEQTPNRAKKLAQIIRKYNVNSK